MKSWAQSKSIWLAIVVMFTGLEPTITGFFNTGDFTSPAITNLVLSVAMVALRLVTKTSIK